MRNPNFLGDLVRSPEADARDIFGEAVGVGADPFDGVFAVGLVDAHRPAGANAVGVQEDHDIANDFLLGPGLFDLQPAPWPDAFNILKSPGFLFNDVENFFTEFLHQLFGINRSDSFDHAAAQIFFDTFARRRGGAGERVGPKLPAELAVLNPPSLSSDPLPGADRG